MVGECRAAGYSCCTSHSLSRLGVNGMVVGGCPEGEGECVLGGEVLYVVVGVGTSRGFPYLRRGYPSGAVVGEVVVSGVVVVCPS